MTLNALSDAGNAVLKNFVPKSVHHGIFGTSANSESSPSSRTQPLSSEPQRATVSPRTYDRRMTSARWKAHINKSIFNGTSPFDPIEVELDDDVEELPAQTNKETEPLTPAGSQLAKPTKTPEDKRRKTRILSEEARTLGYRENIPADAVPIEIPSSKPAMSFEQRTKRFSTSSPALSGALKPMNTMNTSGGKQQFQYQTTRKQYTSMSPLHSFEPDSTQTVQQQTRSTPAGQSHIVHPPPSKKRKLDSPTRESLRNTYGRDPNPETSQRERRDSSVVQLDSDADDLASLYDFRKSGPQASRLTSNGVKHTPLRGLAAAAQVSRNNKAPEACGSSSDDLMKSEGFMKDATRRRKNGDNESDDDQAYATRNGNNPVAAQTEHQARTPLAPITPPTSKVAAGYYDKSPDELTTLSETSKSHRKSLRQLLSPTDHSMQPGVRFPLRSFVCKGFPDVEGYDLEVSEHQKTFSVHYRAATMTDALTPDFPLAKIIQLVVPEAAGEKNCVMLRLSAGCLPENTCFLEFESEKVLHEFDFLLQNVGSHLRLSRKPWQWIENAMGGLYARTKDMSDTQRAEIQSQVWQNRRMRVGEQPTLSADVQPSDRKRLKDSLDVSPDHNNTQSGMRRKDRSAASCEERNDAQAVSDAARDISNSKIRQTRSRTLEQHIDDAAAPRPIDVDLRRQGPKWKRPLVYPPEGPRRESVTWDDLSRLEDDEYLNDSLVALFMRYLQENMDQEELKKMHFFNTFFYETLMRPSGAKGGRRQINYKGVANWTKNIRLFKRDYVIVPVNENAHWYVMIICNLRSLLGEDKDVSEETDVQVLAQPGVEGAEGTDAPQVLHEHSAFLNESTLSAEATGPDSETSDKKRPGRPRKANRQLPRYAIDQPVIITLDSLNSGRSPTATALKDYLAEEAKEKLDLDIDRSSIRGMTAKNIPLQRNFSDCGLYMCMYLEQFVRNPRKFVSSLLQRDTEAMQWPKKLRSEALRQRLYDMLQELHGAQSKKEKARAQPIGRILIRDEDLLSDKQAYVRGGLAFYENYSQKKRTQFAERTDCEEASTPEGRFVVQDSHAGQHGLSAAKAEPETGINAIIIDDDSQTRFAPQDGDTSRFFDGTAARPAQGISETEDTPQGLAARLKQQRSPERPIQQSTADVPNGLRSLQEVGSISSTAIDLSTPVQEQPILRQRSMSVSTDFLSGNASYDTPLKQSNCDGGVDRQKEVHDAPYEEEEVFEGFDDDATAERREKRHDSVVPESNYGDETATTNMIQVDETSGADDMLLR